MPNGGTMNLPDGAKITSVLNSNTSTLDGSTKLVNVTPGSVSAFEFNGDIYGALWKTKDGSFAGYGKNGSLVPYLTDENSKILTYSFDFKKPDTEVAMSAGAMTLENTPGGPAPKVVAGLVVITTAAILTSITIQTVIHDLQITTPEVAIGGYNCIFQGREKED